MMTVGSWLRQILVGLLAGLAVAASLSFFGLIGGSMDANANTPPPSLRAIQPDPASTAQGPAPSSTPPAAAAAPR